MAEEFSFIAAVVALGLEFKRRGMTGHAQDLRKFYVDLRRRQAARERRGERAWDESQVIEWLMLLQIQPFKAPYPILPRGSPCPGCSGGVGENYAPNITVLMSVSGIVIQSCRTCGARWMTVTEVPDHG